jgi:hypothetical protein
MSLTCSLVARTSIKFFAKFTRKLHGQTINTTLKSLFTQPFPHKSDLYSLSNNYSPKRMASSLLVVLFSLLLLPLAFPSIAAIGDVPTKTTENKTEVVVEGIVYCQSCEHVGTWSLTGAKPIPSAKVGVVCKDHNKRVSFYKAFEANGNGYFYAPLEGFKMSNSILEHPLQACKVKLLSSPVVNCSNPTNVNYGLYGSPLRYEEKKLIRKNYEAVIYAAGPLAFHPAYCPIKPHN